MPPPSVIKFLKEQEIKQEQLRQQLAKQEARRGQEAKEIEAKEIEAKEIEAKEIADYLFSIYGSNVSFMLSNNEAAANPYLERAIFKGHHERSEARQQAFRNSKKAAAEAEAMAEEAAKEAERQRIRERNEKEKGDKEEEIARLRISLRPRVEKNVAQLGPGHMPSSFKSTNWRGDLSSIEANKVYDEMFAELVQPRVEQFQKEKSRKGVQEAYEYIARRQKDGIKYLGQWTGSELTPIEEEILERLKTAINNGFQSDIVKEIFNEYLKASNHSGGRRKTRRARKHSCRSMRRKH